MTPAQKKRMEELAEAFYKESKWVPTEWAVMNFEAGYTQAIIDTEGIMQEMAEALVELQTEIHYSPSDASVNKMIMTIHRALEKYKKWKAGQG